MRCGLPVVYTRQRKEQALNGDILNLLYPMAGMFAALTAVIWRLHASWQKVQEASQKVWEANRREDRARWETAWAANEARWEEARRTDDLRWAVNEARWEAVDDRLGGLEEQVKGVGERVDKLDDRVRKLEPVIAVLADRAHVATWGGSVAGGSESGQDGRAGVEGAA